MKYLPYILSVVLLAAIITLAVTGNSKDKKNRKLDERITLKRQDKIPYGTYAAYENLNQLFPEAKIFVNKNSPGNWDSISSYERGQAAIIVTSRFSADTYEMNRLLNFIESGNDVFISARFISAAADEMLGLSSSAYDYYYFTADDMEKNISLTLSHPPYSKREIYTYPGHSFNSYFSHIDTTTTDVLGYDQRGRVNFIHLRRGKGNLYVHMEPLAFSNYFILHKNNIGYYERILSVIDKDVSKIVWDEYFIHKRTYDQPNSKKKGWFATLMGMKNDQGKRSFAAAFWLLIGMLLVYVLMEMRRKQRVIPVVTRPRNDSLDFVKTIGRLYYDKANHKNLCRKMTAYFLEHVRNKYKLPTGVLDDQFIRNLQYKTGVSEGEIKELVSMIRYTEDAPSVTQNELKEFHYKLESFYSKA